MQPIAFLQPEQFCEVAKTWANTQSEAILAVDNIRPSQAGTQLALAVMRGEISHEAAIEAVLTRAKTYASRG